MNLYLIPDCVLNDAHCIVNILHPIRSIQENGESRGKQCNVYFPESKTGQLFCRKTERKEGTGINKHGIV